MLRGLGDAGFDLARAVALIDIREILGVLEGVVL